MMLGHSGVGKTTYMASLYGCFNSRKFFGLFSSKRDLRGFAVEAVDETAHKELTSLAGKIAKGQFPPPTHSGKDYRFRLTFQQKSAFSSATGLREFDWTDYRGGALTERTSESAESQKLLRDLQQSDGVLVFADCAALQHDSNGRSRREISRMTNLLAEAVAGAAKPIPIVITLTKADSVPVVDEETWRCLHPLVEAMQQSAHVIGTAITIACGPRPHQVELPLLFAVSMNIQITYWAAKRECAELSRRINTLRAEEKHHESKGGLLNSIGCWFSGEKSHWELAEQKRKEAQQREHSLTSALSELEPLLAPTREIRSMWKDGGHPLYGCTQVFDQD
jgi:hypothetical protein